MKKFAVCLLLAFQIAAAAEFTAGNLVIYRVGDGSAALNGTAAPIFLDEYAPGGILVRSLPLPTTASGSQRRIAASGSAVYEGMLTRSANGKYLLLCGYDSAIPSAAELPGTLSALTNRVIARVDFAGAVDTSTALLDAADKTSPQSVTGVNGDEFWLGAAGGGVRFTSRGSVISVQVSNAVSQFQQMLVAGSQLFGSTRGGAEPAIGAIGSGIPKTGGQAFVALAGLSGLQSPNGFAFVDLDAAAVGIDTLYVADESSGEIRKFCFNNETWQAHGSVVAPAVRGVTALRGLSSVQIFATTGGDGGENVSSALYAFTDAAGFNSDISGTATTLVAFSDAKKAFRGIAPAPVDAPPLNLQSPAESVDPGTSVQFSATGGIGPYLFAISKNLSGGSINPISGLYTAGIAAGVRDTITVGDSVGNSAQAEIVTTLPLALAPSELVIARNATQKFMISGGIAPFTFQLRENNSGAALNTRTGEYISGDNGNSTDTLAVIDSRGISAAAKVFVRDHRPPASGNVIVYRVGNGKGVLNGNSAPFFLDEFSPEGLLLQSIPVSTSAVGSQRRMTAAGSVVSEGKLARSTNGRFLTFTGYESGPGTPQIAGSESASVNRVVGVLTFNGTLDTRTALDDAANEGSIRAAVVNDQGTDVWVCGETGGVRHAQFGAASSSTLVTEVESSLHQIGIFGGQLFAAGGVDIQLGAVGDGLPTTEDELLKPLPGIPLSGSWRGFYFCDLDPSVPGNDTLYVADDGGFVPGAGSILKFSLVDQIWTPNGSLAVPEASGLCGSTIGTAITLYASTTTKIYRVADLSGPRATITGTLETIASAAQNTQFRGIEFAPADSTLPAPKVAVSKNRVVLTESGTGDSYTLALDSAPASSVTIEVSSDVQALISANSLNFSNALSLTFSTADPQTIFVRAVDDDLLETSPHFGLINHTVAVGSDTAFANVTIPTVLAQIKDNDSKTPPRIGPVPALSGTRFDPTNYGVTFPISDEESDAATLTLSIAETTNEAVAPLRNINVVNNRDGTGTLTVEPGGIGYSNIVIEVCDPGGLTSRAVCRYAASAQARPSSRFFAGACEASGAVPIDDQYMAVGNDEDQILRIYDRHRSGVPVYELNLSPAPNGPPLQLDDTNNLDLLKQIDLEAAVRVGNRIYWLSSLSNSSDGDPAPNRARLFATDINGSGKDTTLTFAGRYDYLKDDIINWDATGAHGKGPHYYNIDYATPPPVEPEAPGGRGFNIEGLVMAPGSTTMAWIALRAPTVPPGNRRMALLIPVTNFDQIAVVGGSAGLSGGTPGLAQFGPPIELDLGGRGFRDIQKNISDQYLIIGGPPADNSDDETGFRLFSWNGNPNSAPIPHITDLRGVHPEVIVEVPDPLSDDSVIPLISDNGDTVYYGDGIKAQHLLEPRFQKSRGDWLVLGPRGPMFQSPITVSPPKPRAGEVVTFTAVAADSKTVFSWDFGDGTRSDYEFGSPDAGAARKHVYNAEGGYTITVTAMLEFQNTTRTISIYAGAVGDGLQSQPMSINRKLIVLDFRTKNSDTLAISGRLSAPPAKAAVKQGAINIAGIVEGFGFPKGPRDAPVTRTTGTVARLIQSGDRFSVRLTRGNFRKALAVYGISNDPLSIGKHTLPVELRINDMRYECEMPIEFTLPKITTGVGK